MYINLFMLLRQARNEKCNNKYVTEPDVFVEMGYAIIPRIFKNHTFFRDNILLTKFIKVATLVIN